MVGFGHIADACGSTGTRRARLGSDDWDRLDARQNRLATTVINQLAIALQGAGYLVEAPEMCWSRRRIYDRPFLDCL